MHGSALKVLSCNIDAPELISGDFVGWVSSGYCAINYIRRKLISLAKSRSSMLSNRFDSFARSTAAITAVILCTWWRHQMETFSALLALCAGNSPVNGEFPAQRPVARSFDVFFDLRPNKRLSKQSWGWWFETPSHTHYDVIIMKLKKKKTIGICDPDGYRIPRAYAISVLRSESKWNKMLCFLQ